MRGARIREEGPAHYHVISRVIERRLLFKDEEKSRIVTYMRKLEAFSGVQILTFAILSNHYHLLLFVPTRNKDEISDAELLERLAFIYDQDDMKWITDTLKLYRDQKAEESTVRKFKKRYTDRMYNLSMFMKDFNQHISMSYNARHDRRGPLWMDRFTSILVQGTGHPLAAIAAYIDLNSVRAGLAKDPKDYHFCGYAEAVAGRQKAREGLMSVMQSVNCLGDWSNAGAEYRKLLFVSGETYTPQTPSQPAPAGFDHAAVMKVLADGGKLSLPQLLRCRVRYFSNGLILGSKTYVEDKFKQHRVFFGLKRKTGARPMTGCSIAICTARRLKLDPIIVPISTV